MFISFLCPLRSGCYCFTFTLIFCERLTPVDVKSLNDREDFVECRYFGFFQQAGRLRPATIRNVSAG